MFLSNIINILTDLKAFKIYFTVTFIALSLSLYEYFIFYFISPKLINDAIDAQIEKDTLTEPNIADGLLFGDEYENIKSNILTFLKVFQIREEQKIVKNNFFTYFAAGAMVLFLIILLYIFSLKIKIKGGKLDMSIWLNILLTLLIIFALQALFYFYGNNYLYSVGGSINDEVKYIVYKDILDEFQ